MYASESATAAARDPGHHNRYDPIDRFFHSANMRQPLARSSSIGGHACQVPVPALECRHARMPALTRRRSADRPDCWHIYYGDVHAGTIAMRAGNPHDTDRWEWSCGFYPGSRPGEIQSGTSATFEMPAPNLPAGGRSFCQPHRRRFSGVALPAGFDRVEIRHVGSRLQNYRRNCRPAAPNASAALT